MTAALRAIPRKRNRRGPSPEAVIGRGIRDGRASVTADVDTKSSLLARLWAALAPETDADATLMIGLGVLTVSLWGISGSLFVGLLPVGVVLTFVALLTYLRPRLAP